MDECREYDLEQSEVEGCRCGSALIGAGCGGHWPDVDEGLSVEGLFHGVPARRPPSSCARIAQDRAQATAEQAA